MNFEDYILNAHPGRKKGNALLKADRAELRSKALPTEFHRTDSLPPVINQGAIGSCVGCTMYAVLGDSKMFSEVEPSALFLYHNAKRHDVWPGENYSGTSVYGASQGALLDGICSEQELPYTPTENVSIDERLLQMASGRKILRFNFLQISEVTAIQTQLMSQPLALSFDVHTSFYKVGPDGKVPVQGYLNGTKQGGHAVALHGWSIEDDGLWWRCRNSWGEGFGKKGDFFIRHDLLCKIIHNNCVYAYAFKNEITEETVPAKKLSIIEKIFATINRILKRLTGK